MSDRITWRDYYDYRASQLGAPVGALYGLARPMNKSELEKHDARVRADLEWIRDYVAKEQASASEPKLAGPHKPARTTASLLGIEPRPETTKGSQMNSLTDAERTVARAMGQSDAEFLEAKRLWAELSPDGVRVVMRPSNNAAASAGHAAPAEI